MADVWHQLIAPHCSGRPGYVEVIGADRFRAVFTLDDLLGPEVLVATSLDGEPLDLRHGAPWRLVSPVQYGYKSVKHLCGLKLHVTQPASVLGSMEHLRARVALEERHARLPARLVRLPYRLLIPLTIKQAERAATPPTTSPPGPVPR